MLDLMCDFDAQISHLLGCPSTISIGIRPTTPACSVEKQQTTRPSSVRLVSTGPSGSVLLSNGFTEDTIGLLIKKMQKKKRDDDLKPRISSKNK